MQSFRVQGIETRVRSRVRWSYCRLGCVLPSLASGSRLRRDERTLGGMAQRVVTNRYVLTADGIRIAVFCTKICNRLLVPLTAANQPQSPPELRAALTAITRHIDDYVTRAPPAARRLKT
jgi:hypothetical protein